MLANIPDDVLLFLLIAIPSVVIAVMAGGVIWAIASLRKNKVFTNIFIAILAILLAAVGWIGNAGWLRFFMTILLIPFIHAGAFFITNVLLAPYIIKDRTLKRINIFFYDNIFNSLYIFTGCRRCRRDIFLFWVDLQ